MMKIKRATVEVGRLSPAFLVKKAMDERRNFDTNNGLIDVIGGKPRPEHFRNNPVQKYPDDRENLY